MKVILLGSLIIAASGYVQHRWPNIQYPIILTSPRPNYHPRLFSLSDIDIRNEDIVMTKKASIDISDIPPSNYFSPEIVAMLSIYFVQGALGLSRLAVSFFCKDQLHFSPSEMAG